MFSEERINVLIHVESWEYSLETTHQIVTWIRKTSTVDFRMIAIEIKSRQNLPSYDFIVTIPSVELDQPAKVWDAHLEVIGPGRVLRIFNIKIPKPLGLKLC